MANVLSNKNFGFWSQNALTLYGQKLKQILLTSFYSLTLGLALPPMFIVAGGIQKFISPRAGGAALDRLELLSDTLAVREGSGIVSCGSFLGGVAIAAVGILCAPGLIGYEAGKYMVTHW